MSIVKFKSTQFGMCVIVETSQIRVVSDMGDGIYELDLSLGCVTAEEYANAKKVLVKESFSEIMGKIDGKTK